jgi:hypothetical protein
LLRRLDRPVSWIMRIAVRYAVDDRTWVDLGFRCKPRLYLGKKPIKYPYEVRKFKFIFRELYCLFIGGGINLCVSRIKNEEERTVELEKRLEKVAELLHGELMWLFRRARLNPKYESLHYYQDRIRAYATCKDNELYEHFCRKYEEEIEPLKEDSYTKAALAIGWLHKWYVEGVDEYAFESKKWMNL